jgi:hypothetical protein
LVHDHRLGVDIRILSGLLVALLRLVGMGA